MIDIGSGEVEDREATPEEQGKDPAAVALERKGGRGGQVSIEYARAALQNSKEGRRNAVEKILVVILAAEQPHHIPLRKS
jgi:hypothetical protein